MLLPYRVYLLILMGCCLAFSVQAQTYYNIRGIICAKGGTTRVGNVLITDKQSKAQVLSNDAGSFTFRAAVGDTLEFSKIDYTTTQQVIFGPADLVLFMTAVVNLKTVTIQGQTKQQELSSTMGDYAKKGVYYGGKPSVLQDLASPINGIYSMFSRDAKNARHFAEFSKNEMEASEDHKKYNKELVKKITNIPDEDLDRFTFGFKPSHEDLMKMTDYDVITYIKKSYENFKKFGAKPTPELVTPPSQPPVNQ